MCLKKLIFELDFQDILTVLRVRKLQSREGQCNIYQRYIYATLFFPIAFDHFPIIQYPGDPTTPGYPSYPNCTRERGTSYPDIPSLPISWATAKVLLKEIEEGSGQNRTVRLVNHGECIQYLSYLHVP